MTRSSSGFLADLGDGLVMRRSVQADADALAEFNKVIHRDPGVVEPDEPLAAWTRDLLRGDHPTFATGDFTIVEDTRTGQIASSLNTISQTWSYGGIPFGVGRPELVGTHPDYRRRGLIRAQFEVIHRWSAERGELVQAITGIPFYYRQFGYEMALTLGGGRVGPLSAVPKLKEGSASREPYRMRPPTEADLPFVLQLDAVARERSLVTCVRNEALWRYEFTGKSEQNVNRLAWSVIESAAGEQVGLLGYYWMLSGPRLHVHYFELKPGVSWFGVVPSVLRFLHATAQAYAARDGKTAEALSFSLGSEHPLYFAAQDRLPQVRRPYAWYLRVADLPGFLRHVAPVLEARLARSIAVGHTGELKLSFYKSGLRMAFEAGRLTTVEPWMPTPDDGGSAGFPGLSFLQLVFGFRTVEELRSAFPDCWTDGDEAAGVLGILFPKQGSSLVPVS